MINLFDMKLPENMSKIVGKIYNGQKDDEGRPHGSGVMEYYTKTDNKYKYEGHFEHGVRSGYGVWHESIRLIREYEPWEWAQMGEYDSAGRLNHPNTKPGPYKEVTESWQKKFSGWWVNDDAVHNLKGRQYADWHLENIESEKLLNYLIDFRAVRKMSASAASVLKESNDPYERYAYGVWLWANRKDSEALKSAFEIFTESADLGIADALQMISRMYFLGEVYNEQTGKFELNHTLSKELDKQSIEKGSLLARLRHNKNMFYGSSGIEADRAAAIAEAELEAAHYDGSIYWTEHLGWFFELEGETEKAIKAYEKCIINGYYAPIFDLALIYLEKGDEEYYESLMKVGMQLGVPDCCILGFEKEGDWESLDEDDKLATYHKLKENLPKGVSQGSGYCAYFLTDAFLNGKFGFGIDLIEGKIYADIALTNGFNDAASLVIKAAETLNDPEFISDEELLKLRMEALRYGVEEQLDYIIRNKETFVAMGYGDDIETVWLPMWKRKHPETKEQISPSVIIIRPSGVASIIEADIFSMSYREMGQLIDAEGVEAIHFSEPLNRITKVCKLNGYHIAMYIDRNGYAKNLADNTIGTLLYGTGTEIRGDVIILLEDNRYDTYSFNFKEDIETVLSEISNISGGLLRIN